MADLIPIEADPESARAVLDRVPLWSVGVQLRVDADDPLEVEVDELARSDIARSDHLRLRAAPAKAISSRSIAGTLLPGESGIAGESGAGEGRRRHFD
ncbi:MAG: hypothetical protein ACXWF9_11415 [Solirubrobacterales bacterium]